MSTVAAALRSARAAAGLSQGALARAVGVEQPTISRLEADGPRDPGLELVRRLARVLGPVFVAELFGRELLEHAPAIAAELGEDVGVAIELRGVRAVGLDKGRTYTLAPPLAAKPTEPTATPAELAAEVAAAIGPLVDGVLRDVTVYGRAKVNLPAAGLRPCTPAAQGGLTPGQTVGGRLVGEELPRTGKDRRWRWSCAACGASGSGPAFNLRRPHVCK